MPQYTSLGSHPGCWTRSLLFWIAEWCPAGGLCHSAFKHSPVEGHPGSFQILAITNKAAVNINEQTCSSLRYQIRQEKHELRTDAEQNTWVKTPLPGLANLPKMTFDPTVSSGGLCCDGSWNLGSSRLCWKCLQEVMER